MISLRSKVGPGDAMFTCEWSQLTGSAVKAPTRLHCSSVSQPLGILNRDTETQGPADSALIFGCTLKGKFQKLLHSWLLTSFFLWDSPGILPINNPVCLGWFLLLATKRTLILHSLPLAHFNSLPFFSSSCWKLPVFPTANKMKWNSNILRMILLLAFFKAQS